MEKRSILRNIILTLSTIAIMNLSDYQEPKSDVISIEDMHNYRYGIVDLNKNNKDDSRDAYFIGVDIKGNGKADIVYLHKLNHYKEFMRNGERHMHLEVSSISYEAWFDFNDDGVFDYVKQTEVDNSSKLEKIFGKNFVRKGDVI